MRDAIWKFVTSPEFWVGGIFLALLTNVLASYMRDGIDRQWAKYSTRKTERNKAKAARNEVSVRNMVLSDLVFQIALHRATRLSVDGVVWVVYSGVFGCFAALVLLSRVTEFGGPFALAAPMILAMVLCVARAFAYFESRDQILTNVAEAGRRRDMRRFDLKDNLELVPKAMNEERRPTV